MRAGRLSSVSFDPDELMRPSDRNTMQEAVVDDDLLGFGTAVLGVSMLASIGDPVLAEVLVPCQISWDVTMECWILDVRAFGTPRIILATPRLHAVPPFGTLCVGSSVAGPRGYWTDCATTRSYMAKKGL